MKKNKIKIVFREFSDEQVKQLNIRRAKAKYQSFPIATKTWMALQGFSMTFLQENWEEITR